MKKKNNLDKYNYETERKEYLLACLELTPYERFKYIRKKVKKLYKLMSPTAQKRYLKLLYK